MNRKHVLQHIVIVLAALLFLTGCGNNTSSATPEPNAALTPIPRSATLATGEFLVTNAEEIAGVWYGDNAGGGSTKHAYMIIRPDGTFTYSSYPDGSHGSSGKFWFDGTEFHLGDAICSDHTYEIRMSKDGDKPTFRFIFISICPDKTGRVVLLNDGLPWTFVSAVPSQ